MTAGAYLVRVTNPTDATYGDYASFVVSNPSGNLVGEWVDGPALVTGRRSHGVAAGRLDDANRFLYVVGGEDAGGAALRSVEVAAVDKFGKLGAWFKQKNELTTARSGLSLVRRGSYLYAIGGTSNANGTGGASPSGTPLATIERAKLLEPSGAPTLAAPVVSTGSGSLPKGAYYYRVAAVLNDTNPLTKGETLPSEELVATLSAAGRVTLSWTAPAVGSVAHYRVYRTPKADGVSGGEVLLKDAVAGTTFTDQGGDTPGTEVPMARGSTGPWVASFVALGRARLDAAATIAPDPAGLLHLYVIGGWGRCGLGIRAAEAMACYEHASISADGSNLGPFVAGAASMSRGRVRHGVDAMTAANGPADFTANTGATKAFVIVGGGQGAAATSNTVDVARVIAGGELSAFANPTGFANERDGTALAVAGGYAYAFFGGNAPTYGQTVSQSAVPQLTATTMTFPNWSNAAANLASKFGRHAVVAESAYFYVIGGSTNDEDALATVRQILH